MHKKFWAFVVVVLNAGFAFGRDVVKTPPETCDFIIPALSLTAVFEPNEYTCNSGYYLPANHITCEPCPSAHTCSGGTYTFNEKASQGIEYSFESPINTNTTVCAVNLPPLSSAVFEPNEHTCSAGYYLPAGVDACTLCPVNNICIGGTYTFNETTDQGIISCNGTFAPTGSTVCYPHILHVGDSNVYLKSTKQTTPSLNIKIGNDVFYANMTTERTRMNKDSSHYLHVKTTDNIHYYVCDDTTCPQ